MNFFVYPTKDTTIYKRKQLRELNFGKSEILELKNTSNEIHGHDLSRILIQFDMPISSLDLDKYKDLKVSLELKITESEELSNNLKIEALPLTQSWNDGMGRGFDVDPIYEASNWIFRNETDRWNEEELLGPNYFTHMKDCNDLTREINSCFIFNQNTSDITIDITNIALRWIMNDIPNYGLVLKMSDESSNLNSAKSLKFYAKETNTIYYPYLKFSYNDTITLTDSPVKSSSLDYSENISGTLNNLSGTLDIFSGTLETNLSGSLGYASGSLETEIEPLVSIGYSENYEEIVDEENLDTTRIIDSSCIEVKNVSNEFFYQGDFVKEEVFAKVKQIKKIYRPNEIVRFKVGVRGKNPIKTFTKKAIYKGDGITKNKMYYSVRDAETQEEIIGFDDYSQISTSSIGHYFDLNFSCFKTGRYYKILLMVSSEYGTEVFEDSRSFSVEG